MAEHRTLPFLGKLGLLIASASLLSRPAHASGGRLLVFLHLAIKQRALQVDFQRVLPGITVTAVGRIGDFERAIKDGTDAILTLPPVFRAFGLVPVLRGSRSGITEETYALVGVASEPQPDRVAAVGALDLLGRDGTVGFVHELLGHSPRVERVSKVEDLLPLLQLQRVQAVLIPSRLVPGIRESTKLTLVQKDLPKTVGLPAVASMGAIGDAVTTAVARIPAALAQTMGVDKWL